jgi:tyrosinase
MAKILVSPPIDIGHLAQNFKRADIEFGDVDHSGASYEGRVFLNNPKANEATPLTEASGYAGTFHIFGHGGCFGDEGHCHMRQPRAYDPRPGNPLTPARKVVIATEAIRRARKAGPQLTVTVVPVITGATKKCDLEDVIKLKRILIPVYS